MICVCHRWHQRPSGLSALRENHTPPALLGEEPKYQHFFLSNSGWILRVGAGQKLVDEGCHVADVEVAITVDIGKDGINARGLITQQGADE